MGFFSSIYNAASNFLGNIFGGSSQIPNPQSQLVGPGFNDIFTQVPVLNQPGQIQTTPGSNAQTTPATAIPNSSVATFFPGQTSQLNTSFGPITTIKPGAQPVGMGTPFVRQNPQTGLNAIGGGTPPASYPLSSITPSNQTFPRTRAIAPTSPNAPIWNSPHTGGIIIQPPGMGQTGQPGAAGLNYSSPSQGVPGTSGTTNVPVTGNTNIGGGGQGAPTMPIESTRPRFIPPPLRLYSSQGLTQTQTQTGGTAFSDQNGNLYSSQANPLTGQTFYQLIQKQEPQLAKNAQGQYTPYPQVNNPVQGTTIQPNATSSGNANPAQEVPSGEQSLAGLANAGTPTSAQVQAINGGVGTPPNPATTPMPESNFEMPPFMAGAVPDVNNPADVQNAIDKAKDYLSANTDQQGNFTGPAASLDQLKSLFGGLQAQYHDNIIKSDPQPKDLGLPQATNSPNQEAYIKGLPPELQSIVQARIDQEKSVLGYQYTDAKGNKFSGVPALEANKTDVLRQVNALQMASMKIYHDMMNNPDLPTSLALLRIKYFNDQNDIALKGLQGTLDILDEQIKNGNNAVDSIVGITQRQQEIDIRQQAQNREFVTQLAANGALGGYSDNDLARLAQQTGYNLSDLQKLRDNIKAKPLDVKTLNTAYGAAMLGLYKNKDGSYSYRQIGGLSTPGSVVPSIPAPYSGSTKTMLEAAPQVRNFVDKIQKEVNDAASGLGPLASRWREFTAGKIGLDDKAFTKLRTDVGLLSTLLMRMHVGARGGEYIMKHFQDLIDSSKQSPENLQAALQEIGSYADSLNQERTQGLPSNQTPPAGNTGKTSSGMGYTILP